MSQKLLTAVGNHPIPAAPPKANVQSMVTAVPHLPCYLIEWYRPVLTTQSVDDIVAKLNDAAAAMTQQGSPVRLLVTLAVPTDEVLYGLFASSSPDTVVDACRRAGIPAQRVTSGVGARIEHPM